MLSGIPYRFSATPWKYQGPASWYFVSLPQDMSIEIRSLFRAQEAGWGRLPVRAQIMEHSWTTAIWFDTRQNTYLLPLKADVRRKINFVPEQVLDITVFV